MSSIHLRLLAAVLSVSLLAALPARAEVLLDETSTVVAPSAPSAVLRTFDIATAGTYEITLTDFAVPAALTGVRAAIVRDGVIVREVELGNTTSATATFDATAGAYSLSIVGVPGTGGIGTVGARVRHATDPAVLELTATINAPNPPPPANRATLDTAFTITDAGSYRVALTDLGFPGPAQSAILSVVLEGGTTPTILNAPGTATFTATPGNYRLFVRADADPALGAGLVFVSVRSVATDATIYRTLLPAGRVQQLGSGALAAGAHTLVGADLAIPAPLTALKLAVTSEGRVVSRLDAPGSVDFTALAAGHEVLAAVQPAGDSAGSFAVDVRGAGAAPLSFVSTATEGTNAGAITLKGTVAIAGTHRLRLTDFAFPQGLTTLRATIAQGGRNIASMNAPGTVDVDLAAGEVEVLVYAVANSSANGILGVELRPVAGTAPTVIEATRGVGTAFSAWQFSVTTAGRYQVFADDLEFPQRFAGLDAVVTRGPDVVGSFFGGGSFIFNGTPGNYFITFIAKPGAQSGGAGTYRMRVATAPNQPTVTLTSSAGSVHPGETARLTWSSTDATTCVASGAWSGSKTASGNEVTIGLSSQSIFNLECTGPGGSSTTQVTVNVAQAPSGGGGGGGGGALGFTSLFAMLTALGLRGVAARRVAGRD